MTDPNATVTARTARIPHLCDDCHWTPSLRGVPTILPGHRYLRHVAFPGHEAVGGERPWSLKQCVACSGKTDDTAPLLLAGACSMFCCGDVPCARPLNHAGDHSCRRDAEQAASDGRRAVPTRA